MLRRMSEQKANGDGFDWGKLGREWWVEQQKTVGADDRLLRFAVARHRGCSQTQAARESGYNDDGCGGIRQHGYRAARTHRVMVLLELAALEQRGGYDGTVTPQEHRRILTNLARGSDPSIKIRALEALAKFDADAAEREAAGREAAASQMTIAARLDQLAKINPARAVSLARDLGMGWELPDPLVEEALRGFDAERRKLQERLVRMLEASRPATKGGSSHAASSSAEAAA